MAALLDTNVLVYRRDAAAPAKQRIASALVARGVADGSVKIPHQALVEFVAAATRARPPRAPLLSMSEARAEVELLLATTDVLYPTEPVVRTALMGVSAYGFSWFDAHLWAYAECHGLDVLYSEDFQHGRLYGSVRVVDPFREPS